MALPSANDLYSGWNEDQSAAALKAADIVLVVQEAEATEVQRLAPGTQTLRISMSTDPKPLMTEDQIQGRCVFVASGADENVFLLQGLLTDVWPRVLAQAPNATLNVCGTVGEKISGHWPGVRIVGRVQSLEAEYAAAQVCLIPHFNPWGVKIKMIEAISFGRASVSTSEGIQGLAGIAEEAVAVADTPEAFANAVVEILVDKDRRKLMENSARRIAAEDLTPNRSYESALRQLGLRD